VTARALAALGTLFAVAACGGGGGTGGSTPPPPAPATSPVLSLSLAGGASPGIDHLWVTVTGLAMHADASKVFGDGDSGWVSVSLAAPVTVDLAGAALSQGQAQSLIKQSVSATGSFAQLRLLIAPSDPAFSLRASASAAGLSYNDQVQYTDAGGVHVVPLEVADPQAGIRVLSPFSLSSDTTTPLSIEWNAHSSLVRRASPTGVDRFTLRDELVLYNQQLLTALGDGNLQIGGSVFDAISGQLDTTQFCTGASHTGCIHDVVASATSLSADTRFHQEVRSVNVSASGSFVLYPLPTQTLYDVVIHGGNMQTIVVRGVFVDPTGVLKPFPTALSSTTTPIVPALDTTEHAVAVSNALVPGSSRVCFGQTIAGSGGSIADLPYVIACDAADPATGLLLHSVTLPGGPLHDALFNAATQGLGTPPTFTTVTQKEGLGAWSVWTQGTLADATSSLTTLAASAPGVVAPAPVRIAGFVDGSLTLTLSGSSTNGADAAEAVITNGGGTVAVVDVSGLLAHGGSAPVTLATGSVSTAPAAAVYGVAVHTWKTGDEIASSRWSRAIAPVDLSAATTAAVTLTLP
jgi:hypothetical protein